MAFIWAPGESSFRYAWYSQGTGGDDVGGGVPGEGAVGRPDQDNVDEAVEDDGSGSGGVSAGAVGIEMTQTRQQQQQRQAAPQGAAAGAKGAPAVSAAAGAAAGGRNARPVPIVEEEDEDDFADEGDTRRLGVASGARVDTRPL